MRPSLLAALVVTLASLVAAPAAGAARGPCIAGLKGSPKCTVWQAKIAVVDDGDTVQARIKKGRKLLPRRSVRINGLQATELHSYSRARGRKGACHSVPATNRLEQLVNKKWVRLTAQRAASTATGEGGRVRLRRSIAVKRGGRWVDVGAIMLAEGHALWLGNGQEWASNGLYARIVQEAAARGRRIWNPTACGDGPSAAQTARAPLSIKVKWDAQDDDRKNVNGEWIRITNNATSPLSLRGWSLRDSHFRGATKGRYKGAGYVFPSNAVVPAGGSLTLHVGRGSNSATRLYWGLGESIFENATADRKQVGDGAYLFDPRGNLRAHSMYPCRAGSCADALAGKVSVLARYQGLDHEWVTIRNNSAEWISLDEYELESVPWFFEFGPRDVLAPGQETVVWIDEPHTIPIGAPGVQRLFVDPEPGSTPFGDVVSFRSWGHKRALLGDGQDVVTLRSPAGAPVACHAWGGLRCPKI